MGLDEDSLHIVTDADPGPAVCMIESSLPKPRPRISWFNIIATET